MRAYVMVAILGSVISAVAATPAFASGKDNDKGKVVIAKIESKFDSKQDKYDDRFDDNRHFDPKFHPNKLDKKDLKKLLKLLAALHWYKHHGHASPHCPA